MLAQGLVVASAAISLFLGCLHLAFTFSGPKLTPRDPALQARMSEVAPVITRQTTMWKAWIGFNASHSFGPILFGAIYAYLAVAHPSILFRSIFLVASGGLLLLGYIILAKLYWFSAPFRWALLALACYGAGFAVAWK
jgi:hypothetical protein